MVFLLIRIFLRTTDQGSLNGCFFLQSGFDSESNLCSVNIQSWSVEVPSYCGQTVEYCLYHVVYMLFRFIYQMEKLSPWRIFPAPLMIANLRKRELVEIRWCKSDPSMQIDCNFEFLSKYKWKARNSTLCDLTKNFKSFETFRNIFWLF